MVTPLTTEPQVNGDQRQGRVTQNISLTPEHHEVVREHAERFHGGNVSHFIRWLINRWIEDGQQGVAD